MLFLSIGIGEFVVLNLLLKVVPRTDSVLSQTSTNILCPFHIMPFLLMFALRRCVYTANVYGRIDDGNATRQFARFRRRVIKDIKQKLMRKHEGTTALRSWPVKKIRLYH